MPARLTCWGSLCRFGAWCVVLLLLAESAALAQDKADDANGQSQDKALPVLQAHKIPPEMEIDNELMTDGEEAEFRKKGKETAFQNALKSTNLTDDEKMVVERLPNSKYTSKERKEHRFCTRCWFEDAGKNLVEA